MKGPVGDFDFHHLHREERKKNMLTFIGICFSIDIIRITAATLGKSTFRLTDTALSGSPLTMTSCQMSSRASTDSTGWAMNSGLATNGCRFLDASPARRLLNSST